jgi:hypothetical protein
MDSVQCADREYLLAITGALTAPFNSSSQKPVCG